MSSIKEIAKALNVSPTTVSMVLNNKPGISESTRSRVLELAKSLGYNQKKKVQPSASTIALVCICATEDGMEFNTPVFSRIITGASIHAKSLNYNLMVSIFTKGDKTAPTSLINAGCKGILLLCSNVGPGGPDFSLIDKLDIPIVVLDQVPPHRKTDVVSANHFQSGYDATEYLISLGHKDLCFIHGDMITAAPYKERFFGFQQAVLSHEHTRHCAELCIPSDSVTDDLISKIGSLPVQPTGFVCVNDWFACITVSALGSLGKQVPRDASVIGIDNSNICSTVSPKLSSMDIPMERLGSLAVDRLVDVMNGRTSGEHVRIEVFSSLLERESTGPAPSTKN